MYPYWLITLQQFPHAWRLLPQNIHNRPYQPWLKDQNIYTPSEYFTTEAFFRNTEHPFRRITNQPPLSSIIKSRRLTFFGHLARMDENAEASQAIFEPPPENWRRPPGRPCTTWMKTFMMTCLRWILGYMRLEIWRKIGLSAKKE